MKIKIQHRKELFSGLLFIGFALAGLLLSLGYPMGTAARMGPGYFPFMVSLCLLGIGVVVCLRSLRRDSAQIQDAQAIQCRPLLLVLGTVFFFGLALRPLGLLLSSFLLVLVSSMAHPKWSLLESLLNAAVLAILVTALFVYGLGMPLGVWPHFLGNTG
ncbi:MAG: tripartite tricarboxylate transporter TctB family protein [bacterium]